MVISRQFHLSEHSSFREGCFLMNSSLLNASFQTSCQRRPANLSKVLIEQFQSSGCGRTSPMVGSSCEVGVGIEMFPGCSCLRISITSCQLNGPAAAKSRSDFTLEQNSAIVCRRAVSTTSTNHAGYSYKRSLLVTRIHFTHEEGGT